MTCAPDPEGVKLAVQKMERQTRGARNVVANDDACQLVSDFMDWDGGPDLCVSALAKIAREAFMLAHYLQSSAEPEMATDLAAGHLQNMAKFAEAAAKLAEAELEELSPAARAAAERGARSALIKGAARRRADAAGNEGGES